MSRPNTRPTLVLAGALALALASPALAASRTFTETFPAGARVRLANLAGAVTLEPGSGPSIEVTVTAHAEFDSAAETQKVLAQLAFVEATDREGRREMALSYPVEDHDTFHYPRFGGHDGGGDPGFWESLFLGMSQTTTSYRGERVRVTGGSGTPMLYADLLIKLPADGNLVVRNVVGAVEGGKLSGKLRIDTGTMPPSCAA